MSISKHTAYNLAGALVPVAVSVITIPLYIKAVGDGRYGILAIAWLMLGYFGLFDLGLGPATAQRIASMAAESASSRAEVFWAALASNVCLGSIGGLLIWPAAQYFFGTVFHADDRLRQEVVAAIPWLILAVPLATLSGVLTGALQGREKFFQLNAISIAGALLLQVCPLLVARFFEPSLTLLLPTVTLTRVVILAALFWQCRRHVFGTYRPVIRLSHAKSLLRFGGWVTVTSLVGPLMVVLDRFVIGATLGAKAVAHYTVPFQVAERSAALSSAVSTALFPRLAGMDPRLSNELAHLAVKSLCVVMTPAIVIAIFSIDLFLKAWVGAEFAAQAGGPARILLMAFWINALARVPYAQLQASGRPDLVAKCHAAELIPYLLLLYVCLQSLGLRGAAMIFGLRVLTDWALLTHLTGALRVTARTVIGPSLFLIAAYLLAENFAVSVWLWLTSTAIVLVCFAWAWVAAPLPLRRLVASQVIQRRVAAAIRV